MRKFSLKSINSKLCFSFAIVACTVFLVFAVTYPMILNMFARELEKNTSERMQNVLLRLDDNLNNIQQQIFSLNHSQEFQDIFVQTENTEYEKVVLWNKATQVLRDINYVKGYSLIVRGQNDVITGNGIYKFEKYFERYWNNPNYNSDFWKKESHQPFYIKYYPQGTFTSRVIGDVKWSETVMPIAFKNFFDNRYMIIIFVDVQSMCRDIDPYILGNLAVYYEGTPLILGGEGDTTDYESYLNQDNLAVKKMGDSFSVICRSALNNLIYVKSTPIKEVRSGLNEVYAVCLGVVFATLLISIGVILIVTKSLTKPFTAIVEMLKSNHMTNEKNANDLTIIENNLRHLFTSHEQIGKELEEKNVMLSSFLYQSKLKNIYMNIQNEESDKREGNPLTYYFISFQVAYRNEVAVLIPKSYSEISFILKEHLEEVLKHYFPSLLLFQPEENSFFAKVGLAEQEHSITEVTEKIMKRLEPEEEYCYFFVAVSAPVKDEAQITGDYYSVLELQQQFCLKESSQLLLKGEDMADRTYANLGSRQMDDLKKLVLSADSAGTLSLISNMLDLALTPRTTRLYANLLCSNIVNVLFQAMGEKFIYLPQKLLDQSFYSHISKCTSAGAFRKAVLDFTGQVLEYVAENGEFEDAVILGVKNYVAQNYSMEFTMEMMAESLKISKSYLSTYFKSKTGTNLLDFIQQFRIQKAIELMKNNNTKLSDIGNQVGITNPNSFIRVFKKQTGVTPSEYRKNLNI